MTHGAASLIEDALGIRRLAGRQCDLKDGATLQLKAFRGLLPFSHLAAAPPPKNDSPRSHAMTHHIL